MMYSTITLWITTNYGTVGKNVKVVEGTASTFTDIAGHWAKECHRICDR